MARQLRALAGLAGFGPKHVCWAVTAPEDRQASICTCTQTLFKKEFEHRYYALVHCASPTKHRLLNESLSATVGYLPMNYWSGWLPKQYRL